MIKLKNGYKKSFILLTKYAITFTIIEVILFKSPVIYYLHGYTELIINGLSPLKTHAFIVYSIILFFLHNFFEVRIKNKKIIYFFTAFSLLIINLFSTITFVYFLIKSKIPINTFFSFYSYKGVLEFSTLTHNHFAKPIVSYPIKSLLFRASPELGTGLVFMNILPSFLYVIVGLMFGVLILGILSLWMILSKHKCFGFLSKCVFCLLSFVSVKSTIDGGLFSYEFITSSVFLFFLIYFYELKAVSSNKINKNATYITFIIGAFLIVFEILLVRSLSPGEFYFSKIITPFNILFTSLTYLSLVGVNRIERKLITILILLSLIIYSLLYGSRLDIISDPKLYMHLSSGDKIMIRTKENIPVPKKYVFGNSKDYLYTASEGEKLFEIIFKLGLNPFVLPARLLGVECEIEKDEVHGFLRNISGSIVEIDPKGYTVKTLVGENILLLQELDRDLYYVYFEISGCEPLKWELLNGSLLDIGFNKYIFFNYDH